MAATAGLRRLHVRGGKSGPSFHQSGEGASKSSAGEHGSLQIVWPQGRDPGESVSEAESESASIEAQSSDIEMNMCMRMRMYACMDERH